MSSQQSLNYQPLIFRVGQKAVVFNEDLKILFLKRSATSSRPGGWDFPGGGLEAEEPVEGVKREAREEAAIEIENVKPLAVITHDREQANEKTLIIGYIANLKSGEVELSHEHDECRWLTIDEARAMDLPEGHRKFLEAAIAEIKNRF